VGGIARRATLLKAERRAAEAGGAAAFTFSTGDSVTGTLFHAAGRAVSPDFRSLQALGYDATTLGNHEFELGPADLAEMIRAAQARGGLPPIVASNLQFGSASPGGDDALRDLAGPGRAIRSSLVLERSGVRVGVLGFLGKAAAALCPSTAPVTFLADEALFADLAARVEALRAREFVDLVVVLAHAGSDPSSPTAGESPQVALNVPGIDVILSGHTHNVVPPYTVTNPATGRPVVHDPARPGDLYFRVLGRTAFDLPRVPRRESGALRLAADAFLAASNLRPEGLPPGMPQVAITAFGIMNDGLSRGRDGLITLADAFRTYPFGVGRDRAGHRMPGYPLVRVALSLAELKFLFELTALTPDADMAFADWFVLPSGARFSFDRSLPPIDLANPVDPARGRVTQIVLAAPSAPGSLMDPDLPGLVVFASDRPAWGPWGGWNPSRPGGHPHCGHLPVAVTTDYYLTFIASSLGMPILDPAGDPAHPLEAGDLDSIMLWREDGSALKSFEAYAAFVRRVCADHGGFLPARYALPDASRVLQL